MRRVVDDLEVVQIDSVNVLARADEMPLWARLGAYKRGVLDEMVRRGELFEYWAHMASYVPVDTWPLFQWRMQHPRPGTDAITCASSKHGGPASSTRCTTP